MVLICTSQRYLEFCVVSTRQENILEDLDRRSRTTTAQRDRFLLLQSLRHRTLTAPALQVMTLGRYQFQISANTVRRRLAEYDLRPRIPARGSQLTAAHRRVRLLFAQNHVDWELDQ
jgi:hypothetical protein